MAGSKQPKPESIWQELRSFYLFILNTCGLCNSWLGIVIRRAGWQFLQRKMVICLAKVWGCQTDYHEIQNYTFLPFFFFTSLPCWFQQVSYVQQFLKDKGEFVLALYQETNSKQTRETKARAGPIDKRALVSGLKQLLQIGQRKEGWEEEE